MSLGKNKALQDSHCSIWHRRMDVRIGRSLWWAPRKEWRWWWAWTWLTKCSTQHVGRSRRRHEQQASPMVPRHPSGGSPSSGGSSLDQWSKESSPHSNLLRASQKSNQSGWTGIGFSVKVNLPSSRTKNQRCCNLLLMALACLWHSCFLPLRLKLPTFVALHP